ncbi:MAG: cytochrome c3 family protein [Acidobacteria bacterium]|nr:cytochrome c3 family protein [Acidobacteriota bacterium]
MRQAVKLGVVSALFLFAGGVLLSSCQKAAQSSRSPSTSAKVAAPAPTDAPSGGKSIEKVYHLSTDSQDEHGEVIFNHEGHAGNASYSADGKTLMGCTECHHTSQPKSALKPPDKTSTSDTPLTLTAFQGGQQVQNCRTCHFQDGNVPDGKEMPQASYTVDGNAVTKDMNNQLAYHINCNTCHDAALAARPELKSKAGFAGSKDCMVCHKKN